jgi:L-rhamnose mutarotase
MTTKHQGKRICQIVKIKPDLLDEYKKVHQNVFPPVLANLKKYHIEDYSIHYSPSFSLLIANFKYLGDDWDRDAEAMRLDSNNHEWWNLTDGMQETLVEGSTGSTDPKGWWLTLDEVFRFDN